MCVNDPEQAADQDTEIYGVGGGSNGAVAEESPDKFGAFCGDDLRLRDCFPMESICEDSAVGMERKLSNDFVPSLRSGEWSDIGGRSYMEDTHVCISDLATKFGYNFLSDEAISFYGVFDGHGGKDAAQFVRDHLPRVIVEDADFPVELEKVVIRSFDVCRDGCCF